MNNFSLIYKILRYLEKAMDYDEPDLDFISAERLGITRQRWLLLMEILAEASYITGIAVKRSRDGACMASTGSLRITPKGLEYLQENSLMKKAAEAARGIAEIIV